MRFLVICLFGLALPTAAQAQWDQAYPTDPGYHAAYPSSNVTVIYPQVAPPPVVVVQREPRRPAYLIAFRDSRVSLADAYWVNGITLFYVTPDHQQKTALLESVDRETSRRLNAEQHLSFDLPALPSPAQLRKLLQEQLGAILETRSTSGGVDVTVPDVLFGFNQYTLTDGARDKLSRIAAILVAFGTLSPRLAGYTDNIGSDHYNLWLSRRRAETVRDYLVSLGVPAPTVSATGFGETHPLASNSTEAGRRQNRRVEILISEREIGDAAWSQ